MKRGIISLVEFAATATILIIIISIFFPRFFFAHRWEDAFILMKARDVILVIDRLGKLYEYSFDSGKLSKFLDDIIVEKGIVKFGWVSETFKNRIVVACNCTKDQIRMLSSWIGRMRINDRLIELAFVETNLDDIVKSDVLFIFGYKNLSPFYSSIKRYIEAGNGVVEMMDFTGEYAEKKVNEDIVQRNIFGIKYVGLEKDTVTNIIFSKRPKSAKDFVYYPFKYFHNIPFPLYPKIRVNEIPNCTIGWQPKGNFTINQTNFSYWICTLKSVWFDTNSDGIADKLVMPGENFTIFGLNFTLKYVEEDVIWIKFNEKHIFSDFLGYVAPPGEPEPPGKAIGVKRVYNISPIDDNPNRTLLYGVSTTPPGNFSVAILNVTEISRVAWITDLTKNNREVQDDEKMLLASLILWASNKKGELPFGEIKFGLQTSYIGTVNKDMFEIYEFNVGIGYPF